MKIFYAGFYPVFFEREFIKRGHIFAQKSQSKNVLRTCKDDILNDVENADLLIMHPSCSLVRGESPEKVNTKHVTDFTNHWNDLVSNIAEYKVPKICIESYSLHEKAAAIIAKPTQTLQIIDENNIVNLWLKNLPEIVLTPVETDDSKIEFFRRIYPTMKNYIERIKTYQVLAVLMAEQWGSK
jgi:hypothetical protein